MQPPVPSADRGAEPAPTATLWRRLAAPLQAYLGHLRRALQPDAALLLRGRALVTAHDQGGDIVWSEPGEKLAVLIGQSLLVAVLLTGSTLREAPPEVERDYSITLNPSWTNMAFPSPASDRPRQDFHWNGPK